MENEVQKKETPLWLLIALIAFLCLSIVGVFTMLGMVIDQGEKSDKVWEYVQNESGQEVRYNLRTLEQAERSARLLGDGLADMIMALETNNGLLLPQG